MLELEDVWIADTGATSHVTKHATGRIKQCKSAVQMKGCMENMTANFEMDIPVMYCDKVGNKIRSAELKDIQVNYRFNFNLLSMIRMLGKGFKLKGDEKLISIYNETCKFVFDTVIHTKHGALYCAIMRRKLVNDLLETMKASVTVEKPMRKILKTSVKRAHKCLGHQGEKKDPRSSNTFGDDSLARSITCMQVLYNCKSKSEEHPKRDF